MPDFLKVYLEGKQKKKMLASKKIKTVLSTLQFHYVNHSGQSDSHILLYNRLLQVFDENPFDDFIANFLVFMNFEFTQISDMYYQKL